MLFPSPPSWLICSAIVPYCTLLSSPKVRPAICGKTICRDEPHICMLDMRRKKKQDTGEPASKPSARRCCCMRTSKDQHTKNVEVRISEVPNFLALASKQGLSDEAGCEKHEKGGRADKKAGRQKGYGEFKWVLSEPVPATYIVVSRPAATTNNRCTPKCRLRRWSRSPEQGCYIHSREAVLLNSTFEFCMKMPLHAQGINASPTANRNHHEGRCIHDNKATCNHGLLEWARWLGMAAS